MTQYSLLCTVQGLSVTLTEGDAKRHEGGVGLAQSVCSSAGGCVGFTVVKTLAVIFPLPTPAQV